MCSDVLLLLDILRMHDGCKAFKDNIDMDMEEDGISDERKLEIFNEVREVVITHYLKDRYFLLGGSENKNLSEKDLLPGNFPELLDLLEEDELRSEIMDNLNVFSVKLVSLQDEWKQFSVT